MLVNENPSIGMSSGFNRWIYIKNVNKPISTTVAVSTYLAVSSKPLFTSDRSLLIAFSDLSVISCSTRMSKCRTILIRISSTLSLDTLAIPKFCTLNDPNITGDSMTCWYSVLKFANNIHYERKIFVISFINIIKQKKW